MVYCQAVPARCSSGTKLILTYYWVGHSLRVYVMIWFRRSIALSLFPVFYAFRTYISVKLCDTVVTHMPYLSALEIFHDKELYKFTLLYYSALYQYRARQLCSAQLSHLRGRAGAILRRDPPQTHVLTNTRLFELEINLLNFLTMQQSRSATHRCLVLSTFLTKNELI